MLSSPVLVEGICSFSLYEVFLIKSSQSAPCYIEKMPNELLLDIFLKGCQCETAQWFEVKSSPCKFKDEPKTALHVCRTWRSIILRHLNSDRSTLDFWSSDLVLNINLRNPVRFAHTQLRTFHRMLNDSRGCSLHIYLATGCTKS